MKGRWSYDHDPRVRALKAQLAKTSDPRMRERIWAELEAIAEDLVTDMEGGN